MKELLHIEHLTKELDSFHLEDVNLRLEPGYVQGLIGVNCADVFKFRCNKRLENFPPVLRFVFSLHLRSLTMRICLLWMNRHLD